MSINISDVFLMSDRGSEKLKHTFIREKSLVARKCKYKEVDWFEYSEEEQESVRRSRRTKARASPPKGILIHTNLKEAYCHKTPFTKNFSFK